MNHNCMTAEQDRQYDCAYIFCTSLTYEQCYIGRYNRIETKWNVFGSAWIPEAMMDMRAMIVKMILPSIVV